MTRISRNPSRRKLACAVTAASLLLPGAAIHAAPLPSIAGGWHILENVTGGVTGKLQLTQEASAANCQRITGTAQNTGKAANPVTGFYCPSSGRFFLIRNDAKGTTQAWFGNASDADGCDTYISGSIARLRGKTSTLGDIPVVLFPAC